MDTNEKKRGAKRDRHHIDWARAFASDDPAQWWAAACSMARVVTKNDRWVDSTAMHEAACGAFDAVTNSPEMDPVVAATLGARRALHWERQARFRLVPPADLGPRRWRLQTEMQEQPPSILLPIATIDEELVDHDDSATSESPVAGWLGHFLVDAGWPWPVPATEAVNEAIDKAGTCDRNKAARQLINLEPELPPKVANGLVLLVAGSRRRDPHGWPGVVWLQDHYGEVAAQSDPGTHTVIAAVVAGRRARAVESARPQPRREPVSDRYTPTRRITRQSIPRPTARSAQRSVVAR